MWVSIIVLLLECKLCFYIENYCCGCINILLLVNGIVLELLCVLLWGFVWLGFRDLSSGGVVVCCYYFILGGVLIVLGYFLCDDGFCNICLIF